MPLPMTTRPLTRFDDATASGSNVDLMMAVVLGAAAAWVVSALGTPLVVDPRDREFNPLIVLALILGVGGLYYLVRGSAAVGSSLASGRRCSTRRAATSMWARRCVAA